jgi:hypothetical protein
MTAATKKLLLTIGAFDAGRNPPWPAVAHLLTSGFVHDQLSLAALAPSMDLAVAPFVLGELEDRVAPLLCRLTTVPGDCQGGVLVATKGPLCAILSAGDHEPVEAVSGHERSSARLKSDLVHHIRSGAVLLAVNSEGPEQQLVSTRVLLQHSPHGVQSHEFAG